MSSSLSNNTHFKNLARILDDRRNKKLERYELLAQASGSSSQSSTAAVKELDAKILELKNKALARFKAIPPDFVATVTSPKELFAVRFMRKKLKVINWRFGTTVEPDYKDKLEQLVVRYNLEDLKESH